jgi:porphobilinogen synthase
VDICLCYYNMHRHCGLLHLDGVINTKKSVVARPADIALAYAHAGADCAAPSDLMDRRIKTVLEALREASDIDAL